MKYVIPVYLNKKMCKIEKMQNIKMEYVPLTVRVPLT